MTVRVGAGAAGQAAGVHRLRLDGVVPLEVWDVIVGEHPLHEQMGSEHLPGLLLAALQDLRAGVARTLSGVGSLRAACDFALAYLGGGLTLRPGLAAALTGAPFPVIVDANGPFVGEAGGLSLLHKLGRSGLVIDFGQTAIKVTARGRRFALPRDWSRLPPADRVAAGRVGSQREALRAFLAGSVGQCLERIAHFRPEAAVVALPCELDDYGCPGPSSYAGMDGDATLVTDCLRSAGLGDIPVLLLNDAELAAASARLCDAVPRQGKTLVLTLGFGVGGAVLLPRD